jgi:carbon-monoxide dehydrogenase large subunit
VVKTIWLTSCSAAQRFRSRPDAAVECDESQPCTHNPLGAKGCGEAGAIGTPAALVGAALDVLAELGVTDLAMPLTPEQV